MTMPMTEQPMPKPVHAAESECGGGHGAQGPWLGYRPPATVESCARSILASSLDRVLRLLAPGAGK